MTNQSQADRHPYPILAWISAISAIIGIICVIIADIIGSLIVQQYSPISDTISDLAAGDPLPLMDIGLQIWAVSIITLAIGLFLWQRDGWEWKLACGALVLLGIDLVFIARHDAYGDNVPTGVEIHIYLVYFLGFAFAFITWFSSKGLGEISKRWDWYGKATAIFWLVLAPLFFIVPDAWDGAYERFLALLMLTWMLITARLLMRHRHGIQTE